jgi:hypothetical protein
MTATLDQVTDFPALVAYLRDELDWPIPPDISLDEATYEVTPEEIGLKSGAIGGGIEIKQLRPLNRAQPWGIFFLNLPSAKLPVTLVRNILGRLAIKKRASANNSQRAAFAKHDLLFIAATGAAPDRRLAFAHFADDAGMGDAATLKVLGWDADDTPRRTALTEASLKDRLHWPANPADTDHWRKQWAGTFAHADTRTVVRDSKAMAKALAALARRIRARATELIAAQTSDGSLVKLHAAFKEALIHDLTPEGFADTYAQTIAYGLLSTAISRASGALTQDDMAANVAGTSPFLKEMLGQFIAAGGRRTGGSQDLDFDELGVGEVVDLLRDADMEAVLADFDRKNPDEDPVIHFYELFLKEYDAAQKVKRGVFYTPRPVVGFIVRSVDEVLRTEFGLEDGLASTATWGEVIAASKGKEGAEIKLPEGAKESDPFVRILDPATGTGTFLVECVDLIHKTMVAKWVKARLGRDKDDPKIKALWNAYVPAHLLPRLTGFELMMAPYAIAHVKLGLKLSDTGYTFGSEARAQIYLTNALEPAQDMDMQLAFMSEALAHEAKAANAAKETRFTVVVGNPPYSSMSANLGPQQRLIIEPYRYVNGEKIKERGALQLEKNLQDDYIKFFRFGEAHCQASPYAVMSLVTNHSYLQGPTLRGLRHSLFETFRKTYFADLHGNSKNGEKNPDGSSDENVFEIQQGVAVCLAVRSRRAITDVYRCDVWGDQATKFKYLTRNTVANVATEQVQPTAPTFAIEAGSDDIRSAFRAQPSLGEIFPLYSTGVATARDGMAVRFDHAGAKALQTDFSVLDPETLRTKYELGGDTNDWKASLAVADVKGQPSRCDLAVPYQYRPFDRRWTLYTGKPRGFLCNPRQPVMRNLTGGSIGLCAVKAIEGGRSYAHAIATNEITDHHAVSLKEVSYVIPLWLKPQGTEARTLPNIAPTFAARVAALTGLAYDDCVEGPKQGALGGILPAKAEQIAFLAPVRRERGQPGKSFGPRDLFDYIYAVLHSPAYRARYADYLKSDFARIPLPGSRALFEALVPLGTELVALHLLDADALPILKDPKGLRLAGSGEARVAHKPEYDAQLGRVAINATRWFEQVPQVAWDFHVGGYQPAQKWLKDRAAKGGKKASDGRVLTPDDILHYRRIIVALARTAELMPQIDAVIEAHGGWPGAFRGMTDIPLAEAAE